MFARAIYGGFARTIHPHGASASNPLAAMECAIVFARKKHECRTGSMSASAFCLHPRARWAAIVRSAFLCMYAAETNAIEKMNAHLFGIP